MGGATAKRYAPGLSPMLGFADLQQPDFASLLPYCALGEPFYCADWSGPVPAGWQIVVEGRMLRMVWAGGPAPQDEDLPDAVPLGPEHAAQAVELAALTRPGPFGLRTLERPGRPLDQQQVRAYHILHMQVVAD